MEQLVFYEEVGIFLYGCQIKYIHQSRTLVTFKYVHLICSLKSLGLNDMLWF